MQVWVIRKNFFTVFKATIMIRNTTCHKIKKVSKTYAYNVDLSLVSNFIQTTKK